jgi:hypothetical protein
LAISFDGTTLIWEGEVHITNFTDPTTGVVTLTLTPSGGVGALPALVAGTPGLPPVFDSFVTHMVDPADTLPPSTVTLVSPGGPGIASHYAIDVYVYKGAAGSPGASGTLLGASDAVVSSPADGYTFQYSSADGKMHLVAQRIGGLYLPTSIVSTSGNAATRTLATVGIPGQPFDYRPLVWGYSIVTGTINTHVDLIARIASATGDQVGRCPGIPGPVDRPILIPAFGGAINTTYGKVSAGSGVTNLYFLAAEQSGTSDSWTTNSATTACTVKVEPIAGT